MEHAFQSDRSTLHIEAAHDLRNALSVIRGHTQLITRRRQRVGVGFDPALQRALAELERATDRARIALSVLEADARSETTE